MERMLLIESAAQGVLFVNGQFCGPMEREGQAFPMGQNAEIYVQLFPFGESAPLTAMLEMREGQIVRLEPTESVFALLWPGGVVQLELRLKTQREEAAEYAAQRTEADVLLRYLHLRLAGDPRAALLRAGHTDDDEPDLSVYHAAVPVRFSLPVMSSGADLRAGLVRRVAENAACVDMALAQTADDGHGRRLIGRIGIART